MIAPLAPVIFDLSDAFDVRKNFECPPDRDPEKFYAGLERRMKNAAKKKDKPPREKKPKKEPKPRSEAQLASEQRYRKKHESQQRQERRSKAHQEIQAYLFNGALPPTKQDGKEKWNAPCPACRQGQNGTRDFMSMFRRAATKWLGDTLVPASEFVDYMIRKNQSLQEPFDLSPDCSADDSLYRLLIHSSLCFAAECVADQVAVDNLGIIPSGNPRPAGMRISQFVSGLELVTALYRLGHHHVSKAVESVAKAKQDWTHKGIESQIAGSIGNLTVYCNQVLETVFKRQMDTWRHDRNEEGRLVNLQSRVDGLVSLSNPSSPLPPSYIHNNQIFNDAQTYPSSQKSIIIMYIEEEGEKAEYKANTTTTTANTPISTTDQPFAWPDTRLDSDIEHLIQPYRQNKQHTAPRHRRPRKEVKPKPLQIHRPKVHADEMPNQWIWRSGRDFLRAKAC